MMLTKTDRLFENPLFKAVRSGAYKVVEWMMGEMDVITRTKFFSTVNANGQDAVTVLKLMRTRSKKHIEV